MDAWNREPTFIVWWTLAPRSRRKQQTSTCPYWAATASGEPPSCTQNIGTNRNIQRSTIDNTFGIHPVEIGSHSFQISWHIVWFLIWDWGDDFLLRICPCFLRIDYNQLKKNVLDWVKNCRSWRLSAFRVSNGSKWNILLSEMLWVCAKMHEQASRLCFWKKTEAKEVGRTGFRSIVCGYPGAIASLRCRQVSLRTPSPTIKRSATPWEMLWLMFSISPMSTPKSLWVANTQRVQSKVTKYRKRPREKKQKLLDRIEKWAENENSYVALDVDSRSGADQQTDDVQVAALGRQKQRRRPRLLVQIRLTFISYPMSAVWCCYHSRTIPSFAGKTLLSKRVPRLDRLEESNGLSSRWLPCDGRHDRRPVPATGGNNPSGRRPRPKSAACFHPGTSKPRLINDTSSLQH